jgi:DNA-binding HxlR family transcriptional regulator
MKTYGQFCPVAQALEILAERWTLLVVRELLCGSSRFSDLQRGVPLMSRTLLSQRLKSLQDAHLVERSDTPSGPKYTLTPAGEALRPIVESIGFWGKRYAHRSLPDEHLDPDLLMWDLQRRLDRERLPRERVTVLFRLADPARGEHRYWLHMTRDEVDLCLTNAGFDVQLTVMSDVRTFTEIWRGDRSLDKAVREKRLVLEGPAHLKREFPGWLRLSMFAREPEGDEQRVATRRAKGA